MRNFVAGCILTCVILLILSAETIRPEISIGSFEYAQKVCKDNGGTSHINEGFAKFAEAVCNNGAKFDFDIYKARAVISNESP